MLNLSNMQWKCEKDCAQRMLKTDVSWNSLEHSWRVLAHSWYVCSCNQLQQWRASWCALACYIAARKLCLRSWCVQSLHMLKVNTVGKKKKSELPVRALLYHTTKKANLYLIENFSIPFLTEIQNFYIFCQGRIEPKCRLPFTFIITTLVRTPWV